VFSKHNIIQAQKLENQLINLIPNDFPCIEHYLYKFKTLRLFCIECQLDMKEDRCIYVIISKLDSAYSILYIHFIPLEKL
jgi:hypothetical protein